jgi:hypothetical protein
MQERQTFYHIKRKTLIWEEGFEEPIWMYVVGESCIIKSSIILVFISRIKITKSWLARWMKHVARMGEMINKYNEWSEKLKVGDYL